MPTIRKRGSRFEAQVRIKSNGVIVYQETQSFDTKTDAQRWALNTEARVKRVGPGAASAATMTVSDLLEQYRAKRAEARPIGRGLDHSIDALRFGPLGSLRLPSLTSSGIVDWALDLQRKGNAPATVLHHLSILSAAFRAGPPLLGIDCDARQIALAIDQLKHLRVAAPSQRRERRISDIELALVLKELRREGMKINAADFVRLAVVLPRRREELLTMRWQDISPDGKTLMLWDTKSPTHTRNETIPLPPAALQIINELPKLPGEDRILPYKPGSISTAWQRAVIRVGIADARLHDLRHEGISRLFEAGLTIEEVALISGHTSWTTLRRYTHLRPQDVTDKLRNTNAGSRKPQDTRP